MRLVSTPDECTLSPAEGMALVGRFVRRRMEAGDPNFTRMWHDLGGAERFERRHRWWIEHRADFEAALA